jgi:hypothetical protein
MLHSGIDYDESEVAVTKLQGNEAVEPNESGKDQKAQERQKRVRARNEKKKSDSEMQVDGEKKKKKTSSINKKKESSGSDMDTGIDVHESDMNMAVNEVVASQLERANFAEMDQEVQIEEEIILVQLSDF